jgi:hypothetical protein
MSCCVTVRCAKGVSDCVDKTRDILHVPRIKTNIAKPRDDSSVVKLYLVYLMMVSIGQVMWKARRISK